MRFMIIRKADQDTEAGVLPSEQLLADMLKYNEDMAKAGVLLAGEGLRPSAKGMRIKFSAGKPTVTDGPFTMIQVDSEAAALEWVKRWPEPDVELELRQVFEADDFGDQFTPELREREERLRAQVADAVES